MRPSGRKIMKIIKIDKNKVYLTGFNEGGGYAADSDEVYGRLENSTLLLAWRGGGDYEYIMKRDDSNNLILDGRWKSSTGYSGKSHLKKIE